MNIRDYSVDMGVGKSQTFPSDAYVYPGEEGSYSLRIRPFVAGGTDEWEGRGVVREALTNFQMVDLLPLGLSLLEVTPSEGFKASPESKYEIIDNYNSSGRTAVKFTAASLNPGTYDIATLRTMVDPETEEGQVTNEVFLNFDNLDVRKVGTFINPPGEAGVWVQDQVTFNLIKVQELFARKYIRRLGDLGWSSTGITTMSEGPFEYRLSLINNLDTPRSKIEIVDFFPYVGDVSIQELNIGTGERENRESAFRNSYDLSRGVIVPQGYDVYYWNSDTDVAYGTASADAVIASLPWATTPAANTRGIRIVAQDGVQLNPNERLDVIVPMRAPVNNQNNDYDLTGLMAWNTFVRKDNATLRFLEPNRVYNTLGAPVGSIEFTKWAQDTVVMDPSVTQYPLAGAEFELRDKDGNFVAKATSTTAGLVFFGDLPIMNEYTIKEIKAPAGFLPNAKTYVVDYKAFKAAYDAATDSFRVVLTDELSKENFLNIKPVYGSLTLQKLNAAGEALSYIRFNLKGLDPWNAAYNQNFLTNTSGMITVSNLLEGRYLLTEIVAPGETGYIAVDPITITITADAPDVTLVNDQNGQNAIVNSFVRVLINKLAVGSEFDIEQSLRDLTDFGRKKLDGYAFTITKLSDSSTITTGPTVNGSVAVEGLEINTLYAITEVEKADTLYRFNPQAYRFKVNSQGKIVDENDQPFRQNLLNFPNPEKPVEGRIKVIKTDDAGKPLAGAIFALFKDGVKVFEGSTEVIDGVAQLVFGQLVPGTYILTEIAAPPGYVHSRVEYTIVVPAKPDGSMLDNPHYTIEDLVIIREFERIYRNTEFDVVVIKGDEVLSNVSVATAQQFVAENPEFRYRETGPGLASVYKPLQGVTFTLYKIGLLGLRLNQGDFQSDAEGRVDFGGYKFEEKTSYELIETGTVPGYTLDPTPVLIDTGLEMMLESFNGQIQRYKNNAPTKGRIIISKYDEDAREVLPGVTFGLYAADDTNFANPLQTKVTNESGVIEFRDLALGQYRVKELAVPSGYQLQNVVLEVLLTDEVSSAFFVVYNPRLVSFEVVKQWVHAALDSVTIRVLANGEDAYDVDGNKLGPVVLTADTGWKASFSRLPKYDAAGNEINYTVVEDHVDGYTTMVIGNKDAGFTVVNTEAALTSIGVSKTWVGLVGPEVTVHLLANGVRTGQWVVLGPANRWQHVFTDLPSHEDGVKIDYSVEEVLVDGYTAVITGSQTEGFVITNTETPKKDEISIPVRKVWDGKVGPEVTVHLLANGQLTGKFVVLGPANGWSHTFTDLPYELNGLPINYTVMEDPVSGYLAAYSKDNDGGLVVTNKGTPPDPPKSEVQIPQTGDQGPALWLGGAALVSGAVFLVSHFLKRKRSREE